MAKKELILAAKELSRTYYPGKTEVRAVSGVSIEIQEGEMVAICGPSGSGKSTLLHLLGLLDRPDTGDIMYRGKPMGELKDSDLASIRARHIGFIFQAYDLIDVLTAEENVALPLINHNLSRKERKERAHEALQTVGLQDYAKRYPGQMSGGQQQRVGIARALVSRPDVILGDEITANLDSRTSSELMEFLRAGNWQKTSFIFSTHDPHLLEYVDRSLWMHDGELVRPDKK